MKKSIILSGIVAIFALTSCEKDQPSNLFSEEERQEQADLVVDPENAAVLTFEEDVYDFGSLPAAAKVDHYVKFTNTGKSPLIIRDAKVHVDVLCLFGQKNQLHQEQLIL